MNRVLSPLLLLATACTVGEDTSRTPVTETGEVDVAFVNKTARYAAIRDAAAARGFERGYLLAGIANTETNLAHCWSEATWACQGPASSACGGGPVIAGSADGPCSIRQGGLGMFQFDAGTFEQTLSRYGQDVLTIDGQIDHAIAFVTNMVKISAYTTNAETDAKARAWLDNFDPNNAASRDQWIETVLRYYNGCQPSWSCWAPRVQTYTDGYDRAISEPGGLAFWAGGSTSCDGSPAVGGAIAAKYRMLGGCGSFLGKPTTGEVATPDGGRYSVFEKGSIYWTDTTGAFEVHGVIRDKWSELGWEAGFVGYPITDEQTPPDGVGRYSVFQGASIYWHPDFGAFEVHGRIRDAYAAEGWEAGRLGYPTSDERDVADGRRSSFQHGSITWNATTGATTVDVTP